MNAPHQGQPVPTSHSYISQRLRLSYVDWGNQSAPPLVLLHGGRDHCRSWDWVARELADSWHVIAPDLRGHGDSEWSNAGNYMMAGHIYDLSQLVHQEALAPVTLVAHSLGGAIALRYAGLYPQAVAKIVAIEGLGLGPNTELGKLTTRERTLRWIESTRNIAGRTPRRYPTLADATARMREANPHLSDAQLQHLTMHAVRRNEDGSFSWKYDPYVRPWSPYDMTAMDVADLWSRIECPTLLVSGTESWHKDPRADGRADHFKNASVVVFDGAGHWVHHDRFEEFMTVLTDFLAA